MEFNLEGQVNKSEEVYNLNNKPPFWETVLLGFQHMLAMFVGIITPPLIVCGVVGFNAIETSFIVSMTLIVSGITTYLQCTKLGPIGSGLLGVQGTSFTFVPMAIAAGSAGGLPLILGMSLVGSTVEMIVSRFIKQVKKYFPPVVSGTVVMMIGLSLMEVGITDFAGGQGVQNFGSPQNLMLGFFVLIIIILCNRFGTGVIKAGAIAIGITAGYIVSIFLGLINFGPIAEAGWFTIPIPLKYGIAFDWNHLLPFVLAYLVTSIETVGDLTAIANISGEPIEGELHAKRLSGGLLADACGSALAAIFNSLPNSTFSQNTGVIQITKVGSRVVGVAVAGFLVLLGLLPKFGAIISVMPASVLGGATVALFGMVATSGMKIAVKDGLTDRKLFILAIALSFGLGVTMKPEVVAQLPQWLSALASSGVAVGALFAFMLNLILPKNNTN
ncbi:xanthine permease [Halobacteroides halobius DSM 5150]|uniref:Xanthine permease n=1 Tax=Halobacteroides halobius (strain ATCC 35273 / DSM 5150 / MD-1) TaxID=748449 RepID=L0KA72_HALHC|nr:nucleobase:cation symporter-2 family protein [Halobacteroides halobius]AGB41003.1 xanthine permease [Halobacteroides halobius DSM 5150]